VPPRCQICFASFPPSELGDWLSYERAEPEWIVTEWLSDAINQTNLPSPHQAIARPAIRRVAVAAWPSNRLWKIESVGTRTDER
jgi:hypothetical protein